MNPLCVKVSQLAELRFSIYLYDDVVADGRDWWGEKVESDTSANHFRKVLEGIPAGATIELYVNSLGGDVKEGLAIANQLKRHPGKKIGYVDGFAASVASVVLTACDLVLMYRNTVQMLHNAWWCACGNPQQLRKSADDLETINAATAESYLMKAGGKLTPEKLADLMNTESWLTATQCLEYGLADQVLEYDKDMVEAANQLTSLQATAMAALDRSAQSGPAAAVVYQLATSALAQLAPQQTIHTPSEAPPQPPAFSESSPVALAFASLTRALTKTNIQEE